RRQPCDVNCVAAAGDDGGRRLPSLQPGGQRLDADDLSFHGGFLPRPRLGDRGSPFGHRLTRPLPTPFGRSVVPAPPKRRTTHFVFGRPRRPQDENQDNLKGFFTRCSSNICACAVTLPLTLLPHLSGAGNE